MGLEALDLTMIECLLFGSALSATDPVTILAIFQQYKVDPTLYSIIFGESLLNDAVSIVLYEYAPTPISETERLTCNFFDRTLSHFKNSEEIYTSHFMHGVGIFLLSFSTSMALGVAFGLACSLMLKHSSLALFPRIESCLVALIAYTSYFFSNGCGMSGIVSLLFCGITLKHYAYHTMSIRSQRTSKYLFSTLAQLSENFIFIYLGMNLFTLPASAHSSGSTVKPLFILVATLAVVTTRYAAVFPLSKVINFSATRIMPRGIGMGVGAGRGVGIAGGPNVRPDEPLPYQYQMMLFWAGLRGAVGVALAAGFTGGNADYLRTTVLAVVLLTVVVFGGTTARMMEIIGIRTNVDDGGGSSDEDDDPFGNTASPVFAVDSRSGSKDYLDRTNGGAVVNPFSHHSQHSLSGRSNSGLSNPWVNTSVLPASPGSPHSSESESGEVFPLASTSHAGRPIQRSNAAGSTGADGGPEEGKWFNALDERYLLPLFSNATASRTFHARKQARKTRHQAMHSPGGGSGAASDVDAASRDVSDGEGSGGRGWSRPAGAQV